MFGGQVANGEKTAGYVDLTDEDGRLALRFRSWGGGLRANGYKVEGR